MSIESRSRQYGIVFDHWQIKEFLGSGSGGKSAVFRLSRIDSTWGRSALKVINLIEEKGNINSVSAYRRNEYERAKNECRKSAEQEVRLMDEMHGNTNIVDYLDHKFVDWSDETGFGCDMLIRMELLEDLRGKLREGYQYSEKDVLKIGRDICTALVLCHRKGILHRDIKPENIFINSDGNFKLGDFGVSRILSSAPAAVASTGIGTPEYAAPEQFTGSHDKRVDIYSLGLVLYELSNRNRLPFATSSYARQEDIQKRQMGIPLPKPAEIGEGLWRVLQKACAYKAADRYRTAQEFLEDLCHLDGTMAPVYPKPVIVPQQPNQTVKADERGVQYGTQKAEIGAGGNITQHAVPDGVARSGSGETVFAKAKEMSKKHSPMEGKRKKGILVGALCGIVTVFAGALLLLPREQHEHTWVDATCTAPRTCEECGETKGSSLGHNWLEATCTDPRTCNVCQQTEGTALGHQWMDATYETPKTCNVCGAFEGEALIQPWIYINELAYIDNFGKVWIMSAESPQYTEDSDITDSEAYKDYNTPGYVTGPVYDYLGNEYTYGLCVDGLDYSEYSITYYLGRQYTTFSGYVSMTPDVRTDSAATKGKYFEVYGDGVLLGRSPTMTNSLPTQSFSIDVTGVDVLTIRYPKTTGPSRMAMIFDGKLS